MNYMQILNMLMAHIEENIKTVLIQEMKPIHLILNMT